MSIKSSIIFVFLFCFFTLSLFAQNNLGDDQGQDQKRYIAMLYNKKLYTLCYGKCIEYRESLADKNWNSLESDYAMEYYYLSSGIRIDAPNMESKLEKALNDKKLPKVYYQRLCLDMGAHFFEKDDYTKALAYMMNAGAKFLNEDELAEKNFTLAYIYFLESNFTEAKNLFGSIKDENGPYIYDANYYYGLINFGEGNYSEALSSFRYVEKVPKYKHVVPYYIAETYYHNGDLENCIEYCDAALANDSTSYKESLHALLAQAYFEKGEYQKSISEFNEAMDRNYQMAPNQYYTLGYAYYTEGDIDEAILYFKPLSEQEDSLGQNAMYLLADCYLQKQDIPSAKNAFSYCKDLDYNPIITENSHFNFIKANYALGQYHDALRSIETFKEEYPNSKYNSETNTLAANIFVSSGNFEKAWDILSPDSNSTDQSIQELLQKVALQNAKALLNNYKNEEALSFLDYSYRRNYDPQIQLETYLWLGEDYTRLGDYYKAKEYSQYYLDHVTPGHIMEKSLARYNLSFVYLQEKNGEPALALAKANVDELPNDKGGLKSLSMTRMADAYFMLHDYDQANYWYTQSEAGNPNKDYIQFQKSRIAGLNNQSGEQSQILESMANDQSNPYRSQAVFELGEVYYDDAKYSQAIGQYEESIDLNYKAPESLYKIGLCRENLSQYDAAISSYKKVINDYPNSPEKDLAIQQTKQIYISQNRLDDLKSFLDEYDMSSSTENTLDSSSYYAAEQYILSEDYPSAQKAFEDYLENFSDGSFYINAHYYLAEAMRKQDEYKDAIRVLNKSNVDPSSDFYDNIMLSKADIYRIELHDTTHGDDALENVVKYSTNIPNRVLASQTLLDDYFAIDDFSSYQDLYNDLQKTNQNNEIVPENIFKLMTAKNFLLQDKWSQATPVLESIISLKESPYTDEAIYLNGWSLYKQGKLKDADQYMMEAIKYNYVSNYWNLRYYLLLSDIFYAEGDEFNAKATLNSLVEDSGDEEIIYRAQQKLQAL